MTGSAFCPRDGTPRAGAFRFCRTCGFDFEGDQPAPVTTESPASGYPSPSQIRSATGWGSVAPVLGIIGIAIGFLVGTYVAAGMLSTNLLLALFITFVVGPGIGGFVAWWLATELVGRRR